MKQEVNNLGRRLNIFDLIYELILLILVDLKSMFLLLCC